MLKLHSKRELERDYVVPPLEDLCWSNTEINFENPDKSEFQRTLIIMVPSWLGATTIATMKQTVHDKHPDTKVCDARLKIFKDELAVLEKLCKEFMPAHQFEHVGRPHEIYLSDFRKTDAAKLRTVLRQPVRRVEVG